MVPVQCAVHVHVDVQDLYMFMFMCDVQGIKSEEEIEASSSGGFYTPEQVAAMDPKQVRRLLVGEAFCAARVACTA